MTRRATTKASTTKATYSNYPVHVPGKKTPFTVTFICHPGKTHNHRSRGDTPWKAQTVKRHRGEPGHTRDTRDTRAHAGTRITRTNLTTIHSNPTTHPHRDRLNSRKNSRKPGVDRSPRPTHPVPGTVHRSVPVGNHFRAERDREQTELKKNTVRHTFECKSFKTVS